MGKKNSLPSFNTIGSNPGKGGRALKLNAYGRTILLPKDEESVSRRVYSLCHRSQLRVLGVRAHAPSTLPLLPLAPVFSTARRPCSAGWSVLPTTPGRTILPPEDEESVSHPPFPTVAAPAGV